MATMNKKSIRGEIQRLEHEFEQLCSAGKVSPETQVVMKSLLVVVELILAVFLEKKTRKNSKNSSIPPSQTPKDETAKVNSSNGKGSKVFGELSNTRTKETITIARATTCGVCGVPLDETPCHDHERRTKIDIVLEKVVEHIDAEIKQCPNCNASVKGQFPKDMPCKYSMAMGLRHLPYT